jgi:hypothetical protein
MIRSVCYGYHFARAPKIAVGVCAAEPERVYAIGLLHGVPSESCTRTANIYHLARCSGRSQRRASNVHPEPEGVRTASAAG